MERVKVLRQTNHPSYVGKGIIESLIFMIKDENLTCKISFTSMKLL